MPDLVFVSLENWDEIWRRNQFLCSILARRFPEMRILFVGLPRNAAQHVRRREVGPLLRSATHPVPGYPNIIATQALRLGPETYPWGRKLNERLTQLHLRRTVRQLGMRRPLLWVNPYWSGHLVGKLDECAVLYDITDDWALASCTERERRMIEEKDEWLCRRADLVVVCSEALARSREKLARRLLLLPNGVDVEHYSRMSGGQLTRNPLWPSPVFGYTGTLHDDRIDVELVLNLARAYPGGSVVLVGPDNLSAAARERLRSAANVVLPGPVPYANLPEHMTAFDVCIVPHRETSFTESLNPIKLWEYLACGKPIVSTNVAGFRDYAHLCSVATGPRAFVEACGEALREGDRGRERRTTEAGHHTWESRVDQLLATLRPLGVTG